MPHSHCFLVRPWLILVTDESGLPGHLLLPGLLSSCWCYCKSAADLHFSSLPTLHAVPLNARLLFLGVLSEVPLTSLSETEPGDSLLPPPVQPSQTQGSPARQQEEALFPRATFIPLACPLLRSHRSQGCVTSSACHPSVSQFMGMALDSLDLGSSSFLIVAIEILIWPQA